jgi:hypothetical protein
MIDPMSLNLARVLIGIGLCLSLAACAGTDRPPTPKDKTSAQLEINRLIAKASNFSKIGKSEEAEHALQEALKLSFSLPPEKCPQKDSVVEALIKFYEQRKDWASAEKVYETAGRQVWESRYIDQSVVPLLMMQRKFAEGRMILRTLVPQQKPPQPPGGCVATVNYAQLKSNLKTCEFYTADLTEAQLERSEKERNERVTVWRKEWMTSLCPKS